MRKKRVMLIGPRGSGKTTLAQYIDGVQMPVRHTPMMMYGVNTIDVPGAYLECPWMHRHLIAAAQDVDCVLMLLSENQDRTYYPPGFAEVFRVPVLGVLTVPVLLSEAKEKERAMEQLAGAGIKAPYYRVCLSGQEGFAELLEEVKRRKGGEQNGTIYIKNKGLSGKRESEPLKGTGDS